MASLLKSVARFVFFLFLFFFLFFVLLVGDRRSASSKSKAQLEEAPKADPGTVSACVLGVCAWGGEGTVTGGRQAGVSGASVAERGNRTGRFRRGISVQGLSRGLFNTSRLQNHRTVLIFSSHFLDNLRCHGNTLSPCMSLGCNCCITHILVTSIIDFLRCSKWLKEIRRGTRYLYNKFRKCFSAIFRFNKPA
jgi:hypothetical protein